jgi:hypothetical protein
MFVSQLLNRPPRWSVLGSKFTGLTYGNDAECRRCSQMHAFSDDRTVAIETDRTEFMASRIAERVGAGKDAKKGVSGVKKQEGMIGVLIASDGHMAVAVSGGGTSKDASVRSAVQDLYPALLFAGNIEGQIPTVSGSFLSVQEFDHSRGDGLTAVPGTCAGPKLIAYAIRNGWGRPYAMSETWAAKMENPSAKFGRSEPIESCNTCCRLIPMMLCG